MMKGARWGCIIKLWMLCIWPGLLFAWSQQRQQKRIKNTQLLFRVLWKASDRPYLEELVSSHVSRLSVSLRITAIIPKNNTSFENLSVSARIDIQQSQSNELNENCRYIHNLALKRNNNNKYTTLCVCVSVGEAGQGRGGSGELSEYINNLLNNKNVFLELFARLGRQTGPDFGHNALNYGLIVHAICCHSYVERGGGGGGGGQLWLALTNGNGTQSRGANRAKFAPHFVG